MDFDWFCKGECLQNSNQCCGKIDTLVLLTSGQKVIKLKQATGLRQNMEIDVEHNKKFIYYANIRDSYCFSPALINSLQL